MKAKRVAVGVIATVFILIIALLIILQAPPTRRYVLSKVQQQLQTSGIQLDTTALDYNLLSLSLSLRNIKVQSSASPDLPPIVTADAAQVSLHLVPLLRGEVAVKNAELQRPVVNLTTTADGRTNVPGSNQQSSTKSDQKIPQIDRLRVTDATLVIDDRANSMLLRLPKWHVNIDGQPSGAENVKIALDSPGELILKKQSLPINKLNLDAALAAGTEKIDIKELDLDAAAIRVTASGTIQNFNEPSISAKLDSVVNLPNIARFVESNQKIAGTMNVKVAAEGKLSNLRVALEANSAGLLIAGIRQVSLDADGTYSSQKKQVGFTTVHLRTSDGQIDANGEISLTSDARSSVEARLRSLNLLSLTRALNTSMRVASIATGSVNASFPGTEFKRANGRAQLHFTKLRSLPSEKVLPLSGTINAVARNGAITLQLGAGNPSALSGFLPRPHFTGVAFEDRSQPRLRPATFSIGDVRLQLANDSGVSADRASLHVIASQQETQRAESPTSGSETSPLTVLSALLKGSVTLTQEGKISGTLTADVDDMQQTLMRLQLLLGRPQPLLPMPVHGRARITATLSGTTDAPNADIRVSAPALTVGDLKQVAVALSALYSPARLSVRSGSISWPGSSIDLSGEMGLKGKNPRLDLSAKLTQVSVASILEALQKPQLPASGTFNGEARVTGTTGAPNAEFTLQGTSLTAYSEPLGELNVRGTLNDTNLNVSRLSLRKPDGGELNAQIQYDLRSTAYKVRANTRAFTLRNIQLPNGKTLSTSIELSATGAGTKSNPQLDANVTANDLKFDGRDLGSINLLAKAANHQATIQTQVPRYKTSANADIATNTPYGARFAVKVDTLDLSQLPLELVKAIKPSALTGVFTAEVQGTAQLADAVRTADVTATIQQLNLIRNRQPIRSQGPIVATFRQQTVHIEPSTIIAGNSRLNIGGTIPIESTRSDSNLRITGLFDLASALKLAPEAAQKLDASGQMQLDLTLRGSLKQLVPQGTLSMRNGFFSGEKFPAPIQNFNFRAAIGNGMASIESLTAQFASAKISASGRLPLSLLPPSVPIARGNVAGPATLRADVTGFELSSLATTPKNVSGRVSIHFEAGAPRLTLDSLQALLRFDELQLKLSGVPVQQTGATTFAVQNGQAIVQHFQLDGPSTRLVASGSAGLTGDRRLNLTINGETNAELASLFVSTVQMRGPVQLQLAMNGTAAKPDLNGAVTLTRGNVSVRQPRVDITGLNLQLKMQGQRVNLAHLNGTLNGGTLTGSGGFNVSKRGLTKADIRINGKDTYLNFPEGMKTVSDLNINLRSDAEEHLVVGGEVTVTEGSFRRNINLETEGLRLLQGQDETVELTQNRSPFLERIRFNTRVRTASPIIIDNNLAKLSVETDLRLVGNYYNPSLLGNITLEEGGEIRFQQVTAVVNRGVVNFVSESRIQPVFDLQAEMQASGYDISMQMNGPANKLTTTFTSNPSLPQPDIMSVLAFGRTLQDVRGSETAVAQQQALSLLAGGLGSAISSGAQSALGLSQVRLEPSLLGGEANPTARITLGENITRNLELVYSMDIVNTDDLIIFGEYDVTRRFTTRATKQSDNSYRFDLNHDFRFGGVDNSDLRFRRPPERKIGNINIVGTPYFPLSRIREEFGLKPGKDYDFFKVVDKTDKLQKFYHDRQFLESTVRVHRREHPTTVDLNVAINSGKKVGFVFEGYQLPGSVQKDVRRIWADGVFDLQRAQEATGAIHDELLKRNYIDSQIKYEIHDVAPDQKRVVFDISAGTHYRDVRIEFQGVRAMEPDDLRKAIDKQHLREKVITSFGDVQKFLEGYYRDQGYLTTTVSESRLVTDKQAGVAHIIIPIEEGPQYTVGELKFEGNPIFPYTELWHQVPEVWTGRPFVPSKRDPALLKVQTYYWNAGYTDAEIDFRAIPHPETAKVDVIFNVIPHDKSVVQAVDVRGNHETDSPMIRRQILIKPGDTLAYDKLSDSRVNLYQTNAFQLVELNPEPAGQDVPNDGIKPVILRATVREVEPFQWRYGGYFDTDRGLGVISDFSNHNSLGAGRVVGLYTRYDRDLQENRLYFNQPLLRRIPATNFGGYFNRYTHYNPGTDSKTYIEDHLGFTVDQELHFKKDYIVTYGYRIERSRVIDLTNANPSGDATDLVAPLTFGFTRERRDDIVNATRGDFFSQGLLTGFGWLGSSQHYVKYTGQYNQYLSLNKPTQLPFKKAYKSRLVYAGAVRVGLADGFGGQDLIQSERFFAGGGTTIRGFKQDEVGPRDSVGNPIGGNALFILNNELRFPLWKWFDGVGFVDIGNVYANASDFNPIDVRKTAGLGLRLYTPFILLRADYGLKLDRRTGETRGAFFVSIGQAF